MHVSRNTPIRGFSLVEVLVALTVISIGMLGIAKIHSLAYSNTATANFKSLAALQASSLAAMMHANRGYWATGTAPTLVTITTTPGATGATTIISSDSTLSNSFTCTSQTSPCSADRIAAIDLQSWGDSIRAALPGAGATISCPTLPSPIVCSVKVTYQEKWMTLDNKAVNASEQNMDYQMFVQP